MNENTHYCILGIHVTRQVSGHLMDLRLVNQHAFAEWAGCFTRIEWRA